MNRIYSIFFNISLTYSNIHIDVMKGDVLGTNKNKTRKEEKLNYLVINEFGPETSQGSLVRIRRQDGIVLPCLINVFNNHKRLCYGLPIVNKHWNLLVNWVGFEKQFTLVPQIFFDIFVFNSLQLEGNMNPAHKWASSSSQKGHLLLT